MSDEEDPWDVGMITEKLPRFDESALEDDREDELPSVIVNLDEAA